MMLVLNNIGNGYKDQHDHDEDAIAMPNHMYFIKASSLRTILIWQQWWHVEWWYKGEWASFGFKNNLFSTEQGQPCEGGRSFGPSPSPHITLNSPIANL